jgi:hypothetical protein
MSNETDYFSGDFDPENAYRKPPVLLKNYTESQPSNFSAVTLYPRKDDNGMMEPIRRTNKNVSYFILFYRMCLFCLLPSIVIDDFTIYINYQRLDIGLSSSLLLLYG